jgi:hypothetical protein
VDKQITNKPDLMKKITFVEKFTHLQNWFPHLTLEETINLSMRRKTNDQRLFQGHSRD